MSKVQFQPLPSGGNVGVFPQVYMADPVGIANAPKRAAN
jgi:hypothetical protein